MADGSTLKECDEKRLEDVESPRLCQTSHRCSHSMRHFHRRGWRKPIAMSISSVESQRSEADNDIPLKANWNKTMEAA